MPNLSVYDFKRFDILALIVGVAAWLRGLTSWRRLLTAFVLGALSALAFAPTYAWPLLFATFPALLWMVDAAGEARRPRVTAALVGWAFGAGYFLIGLHWVGFAFVVDVDRHAWLLPFVAVLFPGGLALFFAGAVTLAKLAWWRGPTRTLTLAASIALFEWLRGHILTGFPWNLAGYAWAFSDTMIQPASLVGIYGLTLLTLIATLLPGALITTRGGRGPVAWPLLSSAGIVLALFAFGLFRLPGEAAPLMNGVALRIVQPDVAQAEKWKPELLRRNWQILIDLTQSEGLATRTHVIWPEAAPPLALAAEPDALAVIGEVLPDTTTLLSGTIRIENGKPRRFFNSFAAVSGDGRVLATYDKSHLVPFGEYLPFYGLLGALGITKITGGSEGYSEGSGVRTIEVAGAPAFSPLICYEMIFPAEVTEAGKRPQWLVSMTDDSWFGPWAGPFQHLAIAKVRAAEEGLAIARAANTGVSAIIDPYGRIIATLGLNKAGILDGPLPQPLEPTMYSLAGDAIFAALMLAAAAFGVVFCRFSLQDG